MLASIAWLLRGHLSFTAPLFFFFAFLFSVDVSSNEDDPLVSGFKAGYPILFVSAISRLNVFFFFRGIVYRADLFVRSQMPR